MKKILMLVLLVAFACSALVGCESSKKEAPKKIKTKVAFVYVSSANDGGYSYAHDLGRKELAKLMPNLDITVIESVPEGADSERVISQLAAQGNKIIFTTSFGYMDPTINVAKKYPDVTFLHCSGYKTSENVGTYFGRMYQARYLAGIVAGAATKTNELGYVAAFPIPEVVRGINAYTLGAQSVNPEVKVDVVWTNTWYNPAKEKQAAITLIENGCDVIAQHQNTTGPQQAAEEKGVYGIGYNVDMSNAAPNAELTAPVWHWGPYYIATVKSVLNNTWKTSAYWGGLKDKVVGLAPFGKAVDAKTVKAVKKAQAKILDGSLKIFKGELKDQEGKVRVAKGKSLTDGDMLSMNWFVQGVNGSIK
jgi:basic membrane protein A